MLNPYERRVRALELEGCTRSDAQAVADAEGVPDLFLSDIIDASVRPGGRRPPSGNCRMGTVELSIAEMRALFAPSWTAAPVGRYPGDIKATIGWYFDTPRGPVEVRDYWWNSPRELSIAAHGPMHGREGQKAVLWLAAWLRRHGITAYNRKRSKLQ